MKTKPRGKNQPKHNKQVVAKTQRRQTPATSPAFRCFVRGLAASGVISCGSAATSGRSHGRSSLASASVIYPHHGLFIPIRINASTSLIQGGSRMREIRSYGSVRGATRENRPYRDLFATLGEKSIDRAVLPSPFSDSFHLSTNGGQEISACLTFCRRNRTTVAFSFLNNP